MASKNETSQTWFHAFTFYYFDDRDEIDVGFSICAWKGKRSIRLYLNRHERIHHLNLLAQTIPDHLKLNQNSHRKRNEEEKKEEAEQDKEEKEEEKSA